MKRLAKPEVLARLEQEHRPGCRMCALVAEAKAIATTEHAVAILDGYASRPGHVLVVLRRHAEDIAALAWDEYAGVQRVVWEMSRAIDAAFAPKRIYVAALGSPGEKIAAKQPLMTSFPHVHFHLVPLADGGEADRPAEVFTWANGIYVFDDDAEERALLATLRAAHERTR
jgi:diadenosine tetraphosphate (Ap4A) HIT family hydrolase